MLDVNTESPGSWDQDRRLNAALASELSTEPCRMHTVGCERFVTVMDKSVWNQALAEVVSCERQDKVGWYRESFAPIPHR